MHLENWDVIGIIWWLCWATCMASVLCSLVGRRAGSEGFFVITTCLAYTLFWSFPLY
jgi:hypothetical protein